jgi:hypothetical protein
VNRGGYYAVLTITVNLPSVPWINPFVDVTEDDWFFDSVKFVHQNGLFSGTSSTTFHPNMTMTRGMMVTVLHRMVESPTPGNSVFTDVVEGRWYTNAVNWAATNGIVSGYGDGRFGPSDDITREQMAVILNNYARFMGIELQSIRTGTFADDTAISSWAREAVNAMFEAGIISGVDDNRFDPQGGGTRAQVATLLRNFLETTQTGPFAPTATNPVALRDDDLYYYNRREDEKKA